MASDIITAEFQSYAMGIVWLERMWLLMEESSLRQVMHYVVLVPTIILYYDHSMLYICGIHAPTLITSQVLTLFQEVEWIWMRNLTLPTGLFLVLRYSTTFWEILYLSRMWIFAQSHVNDH